MAEDFDVEAMLEAPYNKSDTNSSSKHRTDKHSDKHRERDKTDGRRRSRSGDKGRPRDKDRRSRERDDKREKDRDKDRRDRDRDRDRNRENKDRDRGEVKDRNRDNKDRERDNRNRDRDNKDRERDNKDRDRDNNKDRERDNKNRDRDNDREKDKDKEHRDKDRKRSLETEDKDRGRKREKTKEREREPEKETRAKSAAIEPKLDELPPEERDLRTVFCMQLSQRIRARDLEEFFSSVGKVRDVRLITCNKTRRFKGIAYIEFRDAESVPLALGLTGQKLLGIPIIVQHTQAEKNRVGNTMPNLVAKTNNGPTRLYVGSLHFNISEDMLRGIFEPFGKIDHIQLMLDTDSGKSKGYGFITFNHATDAKKAMEQLNGFELAGRPMKVGNVTERADGGTGTRFDADELDRAGVDLGATGRLQLMFKLAEGSGLQIPQSAVVMMGANKQANAPQPQVAPPIATQCFMLNNMFDPTSEINPSWDTEIRDDVISECNKHGGVLHVFVDKASAGNVYCKCPTIATAVASVNTLHGRWFAGRVITAAYVPLVNYHALFPDAVAALSLLLPTKQR